jgi:predicted TPR repeat methyltransferase
MRPDVHYLRGLAELESGDGHAAVSSLRRVLYLDPEFELAAFALGRAHERAGEPDAARRRYEQALRMLDARPVTSERLAGPIDAATVIDACEARLAALSSPSRLPQTKDTWR